MVIQSTPTRASETCASVTQRTEWSYRRELRGSDDHLRLVVGDNMPKVLWLIDVCACVVSVVLPLHLGSHSHDRIAVQVCMYSLL